jgi:type II secretory pathway predicted ATPase ExeA
VEHLCEFDLSRDPFANDPASRFYYESPVHRAAERRLLRGVTQSKGLCLLVGEAGSGKSMLARRLLESLEEEAYEASLLVILQSGVDSAWLLSRIAAHLGVDEPTGQPLEIIAQIYDRLAVFSEEGRRPVVIIDDAHLLAVRELMEALRALLSLEYEDRQLLTLILVGDPELDHVLALDRALPDCLDIRVTLDPLDLSSAAAYLGHRITGAGGHPSLIEPDAVEAIQRLARGLPRRMNTLADNAVFEAHLANRTHVTPEDVHRAARDLGLAALDVVSLADTMPPGAGEPMPRSEPIELDREVARSGDDGDWNPAFASGDPEASEDGVLPAFEEEPKEPEEAPVVGGESPPTLTLDDDEVDRDVEDLFDNLIED